jgi:ATP-dependent DNA helicase RecQ
LDDKYTILSKVFGHKSFRPFQEEAIDSLLNNKDLLTIIPTGAGKSLCYQLPALLKEGVCVVISPLIALMQDQVTALRANGMDAVMINSSLTPEQIDDTFNQVKDNKVKFLYIAPERFAAFGFIDFLNSIKISFFVIDEAHCVSEWGHEFRADYRKLRLLKDNFPNTPIATFTATATAKVQSDIISNLALTNPTVLRGKTNRTNLFVEAKNRVGNGKAQLLEFLKNKKQYTGIVYTYSRKETEQIAQFLEEKGFSAKAYHAGLSSQIRDAVYKQFINDELNIVVATIAFGMGIDKSNIRFVVHTSMPKTMENFYQEIGRAGRDGLESQTLLLYTKGDQISKLAQIDDAMSAEYRAVLEDKLQKMYQFSSSSSCRHKTIAKYFDDEIESCETMCDNCTKEKVEQLDISVEAQKFLSAVYRSNQSFGQNHIIDILRGSNNQKVFQFNHNELSVYGIGKSKSKNEWNAIVDRLFDIEVIEVGEYRAIKITPYGMEVLKGQHKVFIDSDKVGIVQEIQEDNKTIDKTYSQFFEQFRAIRTQIAGREQVAPYIVFSDKVLVELSDKLPQTKEEFLAINGVGEVKYEKYGEKFLELCIQSKPSQKKKLTKTYLDTLELIEENNSIEEIVTKRELKKGTILSHIKLLKEYEKLEQLQVERLIEPLKRDFPLELKKWIEDGLELADIQELKEKLYLYEVLFEKERENG